MSASARREGRFTDGPAVGVEFQGAHHEGFTDARGAFAYDEGDVVTFAIGGLVLGSARGRERITAVDLAGAEQAQDPMELPGVVNRARFLHSLGTDHDLSGGIVVDDEVRDAVDALGLDLDFSMSIDAFGTDAGLLAVLARLRRTLRSPSETRNHLRRTLAGIRKRADVPIPLRDGSYVLADVFEPLQGGPYPVILRMGVYGRAFEQGSVCDSASRAASEAREDGWFTHAREPLSHLVRYSENVVSANTVDWVPRGYVCVRADARGVGASPGVIDPFSPQEAEDYYDAIEWAAGQPFCDGNVGLLGGSYHATVQWNVAALAPPSLRAIIPFAGDGDPYRELSYQGGVLIEGVRRGWVGNLVLPNQCPGAQMVDLVGNLVDHPFDDPADFGPRGKVLAGADYEHLTVPFLTAVSMASTIHGRAGVEAFTQATGAVRRLLVVDASYFRFLYEDCLEDQVAFFERFLKGRDDVELGAPVRMVMRTGHGGWEWRDEETWPVPGTEHRPLHLDAEVRGDTPADHWGTPAGMGWEPPTATGVRTWSADVLADTDPTGPGAAFVSPPLDRDLELAGHLTARLWVSASVADADVFVTLRVLGPDGEEVSYGVGDSDPAAPLSFGCLRVSQRATVPARSTGERPWHTHRLADRAPLAPEEVVPIEVELLPFTARVPAGHRLRVELQPLDGRVGAAGRATDDEGIVAGRRYDRAYHDGAVNRVHTGPATPSALVLPVVPRRG